MAPAPTGTARCMARPRMRSNRAASPIVSEPAAASAEYSPSEWPATNAASRSSFTPASVSSARIAASDTARSPGCAFSVRVSVSKGPSHRIFESFSPSAASTSAKTARDDANASASALPMPTAWLPWPGKMNATDIGSPRSGPKTPRTPRCQGTGKIARNRIPPDANQARTETIRNHWRGLPRFSPTNHAASACVSPGNAYKPGFPLDPGRELNGRSRKARGRADGPASRVPASRAFEPSRGSSWLGAGRRKRV